MAALNYVGTTFAAAQAGKDTYALLLGTEQSGSTMENCTVNAAGADWGLKMPGNVDSVIRGTALYGGRERALDAVRGGRRTFDSCTFSCGLDRQPTRSRFSLRKQCDIGIKGGAQGDRFVRSVFTDMLLGDFSIYDHDATCQPTQLAPIEDCVHPSGREVPIIIRCLNAVPPVLVRTNAVILKVPDVIVAAYFAWCRRFGDTRRPAAA